MSDDRKIIFSMVGVSKVYPPQKQVLKNIYLSFFYGAKIGILGLNGSGKSSLLKIIAGLDKSFQGEVVFSPGYNVGYLPQEPELDNTKTAREIVMEGVQPIVDILNEYEAVNNRLGESISDDEMTKLIDRQAELMDKIDASNAWELDNRIEVLIQILVLLFYRVVNVDVLLYVVCFYKSLRFYC
jgi:energy-dependent translational throttle protein EttA